MSFNTVKALVRTAGATISKHAPEILLVGGTIGFVATVVTASRATVKTQAVLKDHKDALREIKTTRAISSDERYSEEEAKKDIVALHTQTSMEVAKNYILPAGIGMASLTCFFASYGIMKKRYAALGVAYMALSESFALYRQRVIEDKGAEADMYYLTGVKTQTITKVDEETNEKEKARVIRDLNGNTLVASPYAFKFGKYKENGERNLQWQNNAHLDWCLIKGQLDWCNRQLADRTVFSRDGYVLKRGSVMLNEVREVMGEDHTTTGAIVGNRYGNGEPGCNGYIDVNRVFEGTEIDPETGQEICCFWIDPNVDGLIYDLIDKWEDEPFLPVIPPYGED